MVVGVKSGHPSHDDHIKLLITGQGLFQSRLLFKKSD